MGYDSNGGLFFFYFINGPAFVENRSIVSVSTLQELVSYRNIILMKRNAYEIGLTGPFLLLESQTRWMRLILCWTKRPSKAPRI